MSTSAHSSLSVQQFLTKNSMTPVPTLPIHPVLPQVAFFVSLMKKVLKGKHFANVEEVKQKTAEAPTGIKIDEFKNCFEQWKKRVNRCIASNGGYFEGD